MCERLYIDKKVKAWYGFRVLFTRRVSVIDQRVVAEAIARSIATQKRGAERKAAEEAVMLQRKKGLNSLLCDYAERADIRRLLEVTGKEISIHKFPEDSEGFDVLIFNHIGLHCRRLHIIDAPKDEDGDHRISSLAAAEKLAAETGVTISTVSWIIERELQKIIASIPV